MVATIGNRTAQEGRATVKHQTQLPLWKEPTLQRLTGCHASSTVLGQQVDQQVPAKQRGTTHEEACWDSLPAAEGPVLSWLTVKPRMVLRTAGVG